MEEEIEDLFTNSFDEIKSEIEKTDNEIRIILLGLLAGLSTTKGRVTATVEEINLLMSKFRDEIMNSRYMNTLRFIANKYNKQFKIITNYYRSNADLSNDAILRAKQRHDAIKRSAITRLSNIDTKIIEPVKTQLIVSTVTKQTVKSLVESVQLPLFTSDMTDTETLYSTAGRMISTDYGDVLDIEEYEYLGGTIKSTREFCIERDGKTFTKEEIESWADEDWQGKIDGTDDENIFILLGGYNCRHWLKPVFSK